MASFSKFLSPTDVGSQLSCPTSFLDFLPPFIGTHQVSFQAVDSSNNVWRFTCSVRRQGPYLKPVLVRSSWLPFVQYYHLDASDLVTFYYDPDQPIKFSIRVRKLKTIILMGRHITGYEEEQ